MTAHPFSRAVPGRAGCAGCGSGRPGAAAESRPAGRAAKRRAVRLGSLRAVKYWIRLLCHRRPRMTGRADPAGPGPGPVPGRPSGWRLGVGADEPWLVRAVGDPYPAIGIGGARSAAHAPGTALTYADGGSLSNRGPGSRTRPTLSACGGPTSASRLLPVGHIGAITRRSRVGFEGISKSVL